MNFLFTYLVSGSCFITSRLTVTWAICNDFLLEKIINVAGNLWFSYRDKSKSLLWKRNISLKYWLSMGLLLKFSISVFISEVFVRLLNVAFFLQTHWWFRKMKANKTHTVDLVSSSSALLRTRLSRYAERWRKHGLLMPYFFPRYSIPVCSCGKGAALQTQEEAYLQDPWPKTTIKLRHEERLVLNVCVCVNRFTLSSVYVVFVYDDWRHMRGVCVFICPHTSLKTTHKWKDRIGYQTSRQAACSYLPKVRKSLLRAFQYCLVLLWLELFKTK